MLFIIHVAATVNKSASFIYYTKALLLSSFLFCYYRDEDAPKMITDPNAVKPDGWLDEGPETIPDPDASLPEDWFVPLIN